MTDNNNNNNIDEKEVLTTEIATRQKYALDYFSLYEALPDPDPILRKLGKDITALRKLTSDSQIWSGIQQRKSGVLSKKWSIDQGKSKSKQAKIIQSLFEKDIDLHQLITDILDAPFYGYAPIEIMWQNVGGLILPKKIVAKPQEWFGYDEYNNLVLKTKDSNMMIQLPDKKFLCPQHYPSYINPRGEKVLSRCFWSAAFRKGGYKFWIKFAEKYGNPVMVGIQPHGKSQEDADQFADTLAAAVQDAVIVISEDQRVELKESATKTASVDIFDRLIQRCDGDIDKAILGQTLTTDMGKSGSYAASQTHFAVRQDIVDSDQRLAEKTINQLIKWIDEINWNSNEVPTFGMWEEEDVDQALAARDKTLTDSGVKFTKKYYMKNYGFEEDDIEISEPKKDDNKTPALFSEPERFKTSYADQVDLDNLNISDGELTKQSQELLKPIIQVVEKSKTFNESMEKLSELYPKMKSSKLEALLTQAIFVSECWGRINGNK